MCRKMRRRIPRSHVAPLSEKETPRTQPLTDRPAPSPYLTIGAMQETPPDATRRQFMGIASVFAGATIPGAAHLMNDLYDAKMDSAPVLAITRVWRVSAASP
jgi:hypothetical protein